MSLLPDALPGTALPRVRCAPDADSSEGPNACWLAESYGLTPDPWQAEVLHDWLTVRANRWAAARCGIACPRQNGKNGVLEIREVYGMVALSERILHTAHEVKTARKAFARLLEFFDNPRAYPELAEMVREVRRTNGQEAIVLHNGGSVEFIARSKGSGRGFSVDVLVADEAQELTEDAWAALLPTVSASSNPQVILTGTPPPPVAAGEVFTRTRAAGVQGTDVRLAWSEFSCDDDLDAVDLDDEAVWAATNPALGVRLRADTIRDERGSMSAETFARERLGWWQPQEQRVASLPGWEDLVDTSAKHSGTPVFAVAASDDLRYACLSVAWRRPDGLVQIMTEEQAPNTPWLAAAVADVKAKHGARVVAHRKLDGLPLGAEVVASADYDRACRALADAVEGRTVRHFGASDTGLTGAYAVSTWAKSGPRVLVGRGRKDVCQLAGAALAYYFLTTSTSPSDFYTL